MSTSPGSDTGPGEDPAPDQDTRSAAAVSSSGLRIGLRALAALLPLAALILALRLSGVTDALDVAVVRARLAEHGVWAIPVFVFVYGIGILVYVPGALFVGAAVLAYGPVVGGLAAYAGAFWGNVLTFGWVRLLGYRPLAQLRWPLLSTLMRRLDAHPIVSVTLIRVVFPTTAPVNHVLALSAVSWRAFLIGSLIGVGPQLVATVLLFAAAFSAASE